MSFTHYQFITNRTCEKPHKKLANMPAKHKCYTDRSHRSNENALVEDLSCTTKRGWERVFSGAVNGQYLFA